MENARCPLALPALTPVTLSKALHLWGSVLTRWQNKRVRLHGILAWWPLGLTKTQSLCLISVICQIGLVTSDAVLCGCHEE